MTEVFSEDSYKHSLPQVTGLEAFNLNTGLTELNS